MIKGKKGVSFAVGILLVVIVVTVYSFYAAASLSQKRTGELTAPINLLNAQAESKEALFYLEDSGKMAVYQASFEFLRDVPTQGSCDKLSSGEVLFDGDCKLAPPDVLEKEFLAKFQEKFSPYMVAYESTFKTMPGQSVPASSGFSTVITKQSKDNFEFDVKEKELVAVAKEKVTYAIPPATYNVDFSFDTPLLFSFEELEKIYQDSKNAVKSCKSYGDVELCVESKLSSDDFIFSAKKQGASILVITASTKEKVFFSDSGDKFGRLSFGYTFSI